MITVQLQRHHVKIALAFAKDCALGGVSHVREPNTREEALVLDQRVGQLGTAALHLYWFGHLSRYVNERRQQNTTPSKGDGGSDIGRCNVDVKTSLLRKSPDPTRYNLLVRPRERHAGWVYVAAFIGMDFDRTRQVTLAGWCSDADLPAQPETKFPFEGAYRKPVSELHALPPICYSLNATESSLVTT